MFDPQRFADVAAPDRYDCCTAGSLGLSFELRGKPVRDIMQTTFVLNGDKHHYFNQKESWQRFTWPGFTSHPGTRLTWNLRTEPGMGPLTLLKLRGFELPTQVFVEEGAKAKPVAKKGKSG